MDHQVIFKVAVVLRGYRSGCARSGPDACLVQPCRVVPYGPRFYSSSFLGAPPTERHLPRGAAAPQEEVPNRASLVAIWATQHFLVQALEMKVRPDFFQLRHPAQIDASERTAASQKAVPNLRKFCEAAEIN